MIGTRGTFDGGKVISIRCVFQDLLRVLTRSSISKVAEDTAVTSAPIRQHVTQGIRGGSSVARNLTRKPREKRHEGGHLAIRRTSKHRTGLRKNTFVVSSNDSEKHT